MQVLIGSVSDDVLVANFDDTLVGVLGDDTLDASTGGGGNRLLGQEGDDLLLGGSNDLLVGGPGNDRLFAGTGGGVLVGGEGEDQLWIIDGELPSRVNVVRDFERGTDILGIRGLTPAEVRSLTVSQLNARDTLVQVAGENVAILRNTVARDLTMDDFFVAPPLPEVGISIEPEVVAEGGRVILTFDLSVPAPAGGLEVTGTAIDDDDAPDSRFALEDSINIVDARGLLEDGLLVGVAVTIAPGATSAELVLEIDLDDEQEGEEINMTTLNPGPGYIVDPDNDTVSFTMIDGPAAIPEVGFSIEPEVVAEGGRAIIEFDLSVPAPAGGLEVIWIEDDADDANDADILVEESTNIIDFEPLTGDEAPEGGAVVTIAEGATSAELVVQTLVDDEQESDETAFVTLQPGEGYTVDPDNDIISLTIVQGINLSEPDFSEATPLHLDVDTDGLPKDTQGQLVVNPDLPPNVNVYLDPSFDNLDFAPSMLFRPPAEPML